MISFASYKRALSFMAFAVKHFIPASEAIFTIASVTIIRSFIVSPNWSNKFLNLEIFCKVVIAVAGRAGLLTSSSPGFAQMTTAATPFPLWFGSGFL